MTTIAQQRVVELIDDIDGSTAAETITFGVDGRVYYIDLNAKNAAKLRGTLNKFIAAGRRSHGARLARRGGDSVKIVTKSSSLTEVRDWARQNGYTVAKRGRIALDVRAAYEAAHPA